MMNSVPPPTFFFRSWPTQTIILNYFINLPDIVQRVDRRASSVFCANFVLALNHTSTFMYLKLGSWNANVTSHCSIVRTLLKYYRPIINIHLFSLAVKQFFWIYWIEFCIRKTGQCFEVRALSRLPTISYACAPTFYPPVINEIHISEDTLHVLKIVLSKRLSRGITFTPE